MLRILLIALVLALPGRLAAQSSEGFELFEGKIRPLLAARCHSCHGPKMQMGGLDLSTAAGFARGSDNGPIVTAGNPETSRLVRVLSYEEKLKMPPTGKLDSEQLADVAAWVRLGAPWPKGEIPPAATGIPAEQRAFWSFQPIRRHEPPAVRNSGWIQDPIDNFILAKLEEKGISPAPPAERLALLRRATFDLTGLPPTEAEIADFMADRSKQAFARVVERLLASPRYGERWGRHWLDVARYADSTGLDEDHRYPHAWRYRDYVIDAFNRDLPYDRFIAEQLAGDLLPAEAPGGVNVRGIVATGFLALGPKPVAQQDKMQMVYDVVDEQIEVTSKAFMGLTIACARCHDHKFDPILTADYYALASIFASTKSFSKIEGTVSRLYHSPLVPASVYEAYEQHQNKIAAARKAIDAVIEAEAALYAARMRPRLADYMVAAREVSGGRPAAEVARAGDLDPAVLEKWVRYLKERENEVRPHLEPWRRAGVAELRRVAAEYQARFDSTAAEWDATLERWRRKVAGALEARMPPPDRPSFEAGKDRFFAEVSFGKGPFALPEGAGEKVFSRESVARLAALRAELDALKESAPPEPPMADAVAEGTIVNQRIFLRGSYGNPGPEVPKRFPAILCRDAAQPPVTGSGRLELARWLADPSHPLTARVMVNRIWQWHFGEGLVRTASNYGKLGEPPTHPELLDYLAARFVQEGWSIKAMHRLVMLSSAYQMSSQVSAEQKTTDPSNRLWSRFARRRLAVEEMRDAYLALDGVLDTAMGGTLQTGTGTDGENDEKRRSFNPDESRRRTVYLPLRRSNLPTLLNLFDFGDATTTSDGRVRTNVAPQALFMMNSRFMDERSAGFARYLLDKTAGDDAVRVGRAYRIALGREPSPGEALEAGAYLAELEKKRTRAEAWQSLCRVLMASNEFLYVD